MRAFGVPPPFHDAGSLVHYCLPLLCSDHFPLNLAWEAMNWTASIWDEFFTIGERTLLSVQAVSLIGRPAGILANVILRWPLLTEGILCVPFVRIRSERSGPRGIHLHISPDPFQMFSCFQDVPSLTNPCTSLDG